MSYIDNKKRPEISKAVMELMSQLQEKSDYGYAILLLMHSYIHKKGMNSENISDIIGVMECAKQEFHRTIAVPVDEKNKREHGPVSNLDE